MHNKIEEQSSNSETTRDTSSKWDELAQTETFSNTNPYPLEESKLNSIAQAALNAPVEEEYYRRIKGAAKREGLEYEDLLSAVRKKNKEMYFGRQKENIKFYHSTSLAGLEDILESGELLSRTEREKRGEDVSNLPWSSSKNVQFSNDHLDKSGKMIQSGLGHGHGAIGASISFVFGGDLIDEPSFNVFRTYPTVEKVNLSEKCLGIIVDDQSMVEEVREMLKNKDMNIPVYPRDEYDPAQKTRDLRIKKARQEVIKTVDKTHEENKSFLEAEDSSKEREKSDSAPEMMTESEVRDILGLIDATQLNIDRVAYMANGSHSAEQASGVLQEMSQKMFEQSGAFLNTLEKELIENKISLHQSVYMQDMSREYGYLLQAIQDLRNKVQILPSNLKGPMIFDIQQIENNFSLINQMVTRQHDKSNQDTNPVLSKEKQRADEAEAWQAINKKI